MCIRDSYISPQVWASRQGRVKQIKKYVDKLFVILPFEKNFYQKFDIEVDFVGHPLLDAIDDYKPKAANPILASITQPVIALLPGSRKQEIGTMLPILLNLVNAFKNYQFVIGAAPSIELSFYQSLIDAATLSKEAVILLQNQTYPLLNHATAAIVTSGTATLETALFEVPQVVCYKGNWLTYQIAKRLIKIPYISLVNLIANRPVVKELIQDDLTNENLQAAVVQILEKEKAMELKLAYQNIKEQLGNIGASERAATLMIKYLLRK